MALRLRLPAPERHLDYRLSELDGQSLADRLAGGAETADPAAEPEGLAGGA